MTRRWRWVTRDKHTTYGSVVSIWPGLTRPRYCYDDTDLCDRTVVDWFQQPFVGHSIDTDAVEFRKMFGFALRQGEIFKVEFGGKILPE